MPHKQFLGPLLLEVLCDDYLGCLNIKHKSVVVLDNEHEGNNVRFLVLSSTAGTNACHHEESLTDVTNQVMSFGWILSFESDIMSHETLIREKMSFLVKIPFLTGRKACSLYVLLIMPSVKNSLITVLVPLCTGLLLQG
jgi:hypothetical protein